MPTTKPKRNILTLSRSTLTPPPSLSPSEKIARVHSAAGNNLYNLQLPTGAAILAELPSKFRNTIWIKRGNYVVVDVGALAERGNKLGGEIVNIVRDEKVWRKMAFWPGEFVAKRVAWQEDEEDEGPKFPPSEEEEDES